eukprot:TRINITY_DN12130_c0_g1_i1.p1 TRINITY_DN12130_c0_g1~~TRINITY_DN12130_c0_g1_i1.p1  ORF type:complete len:122 (+),score=17.37 TRINITY_DN12130_c0_g1_i1:49-414(+)
MGGGSHYPVPQFVYSPSGGWWPKPDPRWKTKAIIPAFFLYGTASLVIFWSSTRERRISRATLPESLWRPVPSHYIGSHPNIDDPEFEEKAIRYYAKNKSWLPLFFSEARRQQRLAREGQEV